MMTARKMGTCRYLNIENLSVLQWKMSGVFMQNTRIEYNQLNSIQSSILRKPVHFSQAEFSLLVLQWLLVASCTARQYHAFVSALSVKVEMVLLQETHSEEKTSWYVFFLYYIITICYAAIARESLCCAQCKGDTQSDRLFAFSTRSVTAQVKSI